MTFIKLAKGWLWLFALGWTVPLRIVRWQLYKPSARRNSDSCRAGNGPDWHGARASR